MASDEQNAVRFRYPTFVALAALVACAETAFERLDQPPPSSFTAASFTMVVEKNSAAIDGAVVRSAFFEVADFRMALGRSPSASEHGVTAPAVVVVSHALWEERFQSSPQIIGASLEVDGRPLTIVGVAPASFQPDGAGSLWLPGGN